MPGANGPSRQPLIRGIGTDRALVKKATLWIRQEIFHLPPTDLTAFARDGGKKILAVVSLVSIAGIASGPSRNV